MTVRHVVEVGQFDRPQVERLFERADRMRGLAITQSNLTNQQGVVKSEVRVNVLNQPYGGFPWLLMPQKANKNWNNAHNFYGDLKDRFAEMAKLA